MKNSKEDLHEMVYSLVLSQLWLDQHDTIQDTPLFKQEVKQSMRRTEEVLTKAYGRHFKEVFLADEDTMFRAMNSISKICEKLSSMSLENVILVGEIIDGIESGQVKIESNETSTVNNHSV